MSDEENDFEKRSKKLKFPINLRSLIDDDKFKPESKFSVGDPEKKKKIRIEIQEGFSNDNKNSLL